MITMSVIVLVGVILLSVAGLILMLVLGLPFLLLFGLLPWILRIAGVVLLVKALFDKPMRWESFMPAVVAFVIAGVLRWIF